MSLNLVTGAEPSLRVRYGRLALEERAVQCPHLGAAVRLHTGEIGDADVPGLREHMASCPCCRLLESELEQRDTRRWLAVAAALLLAIPTGWWITSQRTGPLVTPELPGLMPKGGEAVEVVDRFSVAARRADREWIVVDGDRLAAGDIVGFFASMTRPGYVLVAHVDHDRSVTLLYPAAGTASVWRDSGPDQALSDSARVGPATGCNWFVAVFSDAPVSADRVRRAVDAAERGAGCALRLTVEGARTLEVLAVDRSE